MSNVESRRAPALFSARLISAGHRLLNSHNSYRSWQVALEFAQQNAIRIRWWYNPFHSLCPMQIIQGILTHTLIVVCGWKFTIGSAFAE
jgi:hypothetical protein